MIKRDRIYVEDLIVEPSQIEVFFNILGQVVRSKLLEGGRESARYIKTLLKIDDAGILLGKNTNIRLVLENLMLSL